MSGDLPSFWIGCGKDATLVVPWTEDGKRGMKIGDKFLDTE